MTAKWKNFTENELKEMYLSSKTFKEFCSKMGYKSPYDQLSAKFKLIYPWYKGFAHYKNLTNLKVGKLTVLEKTDKRTKRGNVIWKCKCECGNICEVSSEHLNSTNIQISCGCQRYSYYEQKINDILQELNINFQKEYSFQNLYGEKGLLRFDFAIFIKTYLILLEYNGEQHYNSNFYGGVERYNKQQKYDNLKKEYCKNHNIPLIIIPYWDKDKISKDYIIQLLNKETEEI